MPDRHSLYTGVYLSSRSLPIPHSYLYKNLKIMSSLPSNYNEITSPEHFQSLLSADLNRVSLINFWAPWAAPCAQMNEVVLELAKKYPQLLVLHVEAESQSDISESFEIEAVPTFIILRVSTCFSGRGNAPVHQGGSMSPAGTYATWTYIWCRRSYLDQLDRKSRPSTILRPPARTHRPNSRYCAQLLRA